MPKDVLITPASANVQFKQASGNTEGLIELTDDGYLKITASNSGILLGDTASDVYIGDGVTSVDIIFEQSGAVRALTGKTLTIGQSDSTVRVNAPLQITNTTLVANLNADLLDGLNSSSFSNTAYGNSSFGHANAAFIHANSVFIVANGTAIAANTPSATANSAASYANSGFAVANSAASYANSAFLSANNIAGVNLTQNNNISSAASYANSAFTRANNSLSANVGGTITGDVSITGNLTVTGNTTYTNTITVLIGDNIIVLNADLPQASQPTENAGIEIDRGAQPNSSFLWIETSGKWAANNGNTQIFVASEATLTSAFNHANSAFTAANGTAIFANTPSHVANSASSYANSAFSTANNSAGVNLTQNTNITAVSSYANSAFIHANAAFNTANTAGGATIGDVLALSIALG